MTTDAMRAFAFAFRRKGAPSMERSKLLSMLTFDLRWFSPDPAKKLVQRAIAAGILREEGDVVHAEFDPSTIDIPVNFRPREDAADEALPTMPTRAPRETPAEAERARRGDLVSLEVAQLIVERRAGHDVKEKARELEERLLRR